ncbi:MAG: hypothetical protein L0154_00330 [Chloroflexi bacterium]|nr:hypothetical protein [Chloroflexota bacterium]
MSHVEKEPQVRPPSIQNDQQQGQAAAIVILLVVLSFIIGGLYLAQATTNITTARDIELLDEERGRIERDNERLKGDIARSQRLDNLHTRAATLGFEQAGPDDIQYIVVDGYEYAVVAPTPTLLEFTPTPETYEENFAGWLKRQFDQFKGQFSDWSG